MEILAKLNDMEKSDETRDERTKLLERIRELRNELKGINLTDEFLKKAKTEGREAKAKACMKEHTGFRKR